MFQIYELVENLKLRQNPVFSLFIIHYRLGRANGYGTTYGMEILTPYATFVWRMYFPEDVNIKVFIINLYFDVLKIYKKQNKQKIIIRFFFF